MIRIHACAQKKVPMPGYEFSSQSFSAGLEVEASDADDPEAIRRRLRELYLLLNRAVDEQIAQAQGAGDAQQPTAAAQSRAPRTPATSNGHNGRGQRSNRRGQVVPATQAQIRAIKSIVAEQDLELTALLAPYGVTAPEALTIRAASKVIDDLKAQKSNGNRH